MIGEMLILFGLIIIAILVLGLLALVGWLIYSMVSLSKSSHQTTVSTLELLEKQAALIASQDALAYQAIRAVDVYSSYDEGSNSPDIEESSSGLGTDGDPAQEVGFSGDPFVAGNPFDAKL